jgi:hypothetical protein
VDVRDAGTRSRSTQALFSQPYTSYPASPEPPVSTDGSQARSIRPQSTMAGVSPVGTDGAIVSAGSVDVVVVVGAAVVVVTHGSVVAATGALIAEAFPALSTAETAYEMLVDPLTLVSDVAVAGARTCFQKTLLR